MGTSVLTNVVDVVFIVPISGEKIIDCGSIHLYRNDYFYNPCTFPYSKERRK
jgi:hypothetical protein